MDDGHLLSRKWDRRIVPMSNIRRINDKAPTHKQFEMDGEVVFCFRVKKFKTETGHFYSKGPIGNNPTVISSHHFRWKKNIAQANKKGHATHFTKILIIFVTPVPERAGGRARFVNLGV